MFLHMDKTLLFHLKHTAVIFNPVLTCGRLIEILLRVNSNVHGPTPQDNRPPTNTRAHREAHSQ